MQPNAPGTQGYNRYSYTASNPTTWTDPSGHSVDDATQVQGDVHALLAKLAHWGDLVLRLMPALLALSVLGGGITAPLAVYVLVLVAMLATIIGLTLVFLSEDWDFSAGEQPTGEPPPSPGPVAPESQCPFTGGVTFDALWSLIKMTVFGGSSALQAVVSCISDDEALTIERKVQLLNRLSLLLLATTVAILDFNTIAFCVFSSVLCGEAYQMWKRSPWFAAGVAASGYTSNAAAALSCTDSGVVTADCIGDVAGGYFTMRSAFAIDPHVALAASTAAYCAAYPDDCRYVLSELKAIVS